MLGARSCLCPWSLSLHRQVRWRPSGRPRSTTPRWMWRTCCRICIARSTMCKRCLRPPRNAHRLTFATSSQKEARVERDPLLRTRAQLQRAISDEDYYRAAELFEALQEMEQVVVFYNPAATATSTHHTIAAPLPLIPFPPFLSAYLTSFTILQLQQRLQQHQRQQEHNSDAGALI